MDAIIFYKDKPDKFECDIRIEGASYVKSKTRLILEFSDRTLMFSGEINEGHVSIDIPKLPEISDSEGKAILEVIADQTYFEAWSSNFKLKNQKSVQVAEVSINSSPSTSIVVENIEKEKKEVVEETHENKKSIFKNTCTDKNKRFVKQTLSKYKLLNESKAKSKNKNLKTYIPTMSMQKWANTVFCDPTSKYARYCMMELEQSL